MIIKGIYGEAKVFTDNVEEGALQQIKEFLDQDYTKDKKCKDNARRAPGNRLCNWSYS